LLAKLNTADVCVNPDIATEMNDISTMNKVMEYMALGKRSTHAPTTALPSADNVRRRRSSDSFLPDQAD
jgi:hypothetical protein